MKKIINHILLSVSLVFAGQVSLVAQNVTPSSNQNYTVSYKMRQALTPSQVATTLDINKTMPSVTYYDGIGRVVQSVEVGGTPLKKDMILPVEYDVLGRSDVKQHLVYPLTTVGGTYQSSALTAQRNYYTNVFSSADGNYAYSYMEYDHSPLNRITKSRKSGSVYQGSSITNAYSTNTASDNVLRIRCNTSEAFYINGYYPANKLYKTTTTNEDGLVVQVFSDFMGRTILERSTDGTTVMNTYYAYDEYNFEQLKWVISPEGAKSLGTSGTYNKNDDLAKQYCYYYQYNGAGDVIEKRDPGTESTYIRYNISNGHKLVAKQTGSQRTNNEWLLYEYYPTGELYRMYRYKYNSGYGTPAQIDSWITAGTLYQTTNVQEGGVVALYEYDRYSSGSTLTFQSISGLSLSTDQSRLKGLKTYEKVYNTDNSTYAERRFYYDSKARLIQTVERNHLGYTSRYSYEYDFWGNILTTHESHQVNSSTTHVVLKRNTYDHRNRLLTTTITLNSSTPATVTYTYNELGQLQTKKLGNVSTISNLYNIQGWLTSQSSSKFSLNLDYFSAGRRDGNVTKLDWGQGSATDQYYTLSYDKFGRMTSAIHSLSKFNETIGGYDLNGNIKSLLRTSNGSVSDNFTYTYNGNRLANLSGISGSYAYDDSGNLTNDPRKKLNFRWNSLNLIHEVTSGSTVQARYIYSYAGAKVKVQDAGNINGYDYLGSLTLVKTNNTVTPEYHFGEGLIRGNEVMYFEKDHLGSTRVVLNTSGSILEKNDYYPFGLRHTNSSYVITANNRYKFNGKEDQAVGSLGLLDYGARMYDSQIGRWLGVDPMAEKYYSSSPYIYCGNNPINRIDPNGKEWTYVVGDDGHITITVTLNFSVSGNFTANQIAAYKKTIADQFHNTIYEASGGTMSGNITFEEENSDIVQSLSLGNMDGTIGGVTTYFDSSVNLYNRSGELRTLANIASDAVHEIFHTVRLDHPFEITQTEDTELLRVAPNSYVSTLSTAVNIVDNIMSYPNITIDGKRGSNLNSLTKGQLKFVMDEINLQKQGYGFVPKYNSTLTPEQNATLYKQYYHDYWLNIPGKPVGSK